MLLPGWLMELPLVCFECRQCYCLDLVFMWQVLLPQWLMSIYVSNIARHTFTHTPSWVIIILEKHFPQIRRSHARDLAKACLSNQNLSSVLEKINLIHIENRLRNIHAQITSEYGKENVKTF